MAIFILFVLLDLVVLVICNRLAIVSAGRKLVKASSLPPSIELPRAANEWVGCGKGEKKVLQWLCGGILSGFTRQELTAPLLLIKATCECREEVECKDISLEILR